MLVRKSLVFIVLILCVAPTITAQTVSSRLVDAKTQKGIPYATIQYGENKGVITNAEGHFSFILEKDSLTIDSVYISSLGYEKIGFTLEQLQDSVITVQPKNIKLAGVYVFDKELSVEQILENMKANLDKNHRDIHLKKRFFLRQSYHDKLFKSEVTFKKSTIEEIDKDLIDSTMSLIPKASSYYTETLGDLYLNPNKEEGNKLTIIKAAELYNKDNEVSLEAIQEKFNQILEKNLKQDSYLKIKSGWFSTKVEVDSILENTEEAELSEETTEPEKTNFLPNRKRTLRTMHQRMWSKKTNLDVIKKSKNYDFALKGYNEVQGEGVYVLEFAPKGGADFTGTLYVNVNDFAIMRIDYTNVKALRNFKLLGISNKSHTYKGTTVYSKTKQGPYTLRFANFTYGNTVGVDRPLKIVEKNKNVKGRRKQNELRVNIDFVNNHFSQYELVIYDIDESGKSIYDGVTEDKTIKPTYLPAYDPSFWAGYTIMEPNQAIREFTAEGE